MGLRIFHSSQPYHYTLLPDRREEAIPANGQFDILGRVDYNVGTQIKEVGADMAKERDYAREWETAKTRGELKIGVKVTQQLNDDFAARCEQNGTTKNAVLKSYILRYTYENFDQ